MAPPAPIPSAVASAAILLDATATRATITKLGPGLITPMLSAATILASDASSCIDNPPGRVRELLVGVWRRVDRPARIGTEGMIHEKHPAAVGQPGVFH